MSTGKGTTWSRLAAQPGPNPLWAHPLTGYVWLGIAGWWASTSGLPWWLVLLGSLLMVPVGLLLGRVLVRKAARETPEGQDAQRWAGYTAAAMAVVNAVWVSSAAAFNVVAPVDMTAFGVLAAGLLPVALMYAHTRALLLEHRILVGEQLRPRRAAKRHGTCDLRRHLRRFRRQRRYGRIVLTCLAIEHAEEARHQHEHPCGHQGVAAWPYRQRGQPASQGESGGCARAWRRSHYTEY